MSKIVLLFYPAGEKSLVEEDSAGMEHFGEKSSWLECITLFIWVQHASSLINCYESICEFGFNHLGNWKSPPRRGSLRYYLLCSSHYMFFNDSADSIYVRGYEERMDLLRAAIVGPAGTPYHDGLFFFDIFLPSDYPNEPPVRI